MQLTLKVIDAAGQVIASATAADETFLVHRAEYQDGDRIAVETDMPGCHIVLSLDDAMPSAVVYLARETYALAVPFGQRRIAYSPNAFAGSRHRLAVRTARAEEVAARRNLAFNPWDDHANDTLFPHASANVETRGEAIFAARNAIDGEKANDDHGRWPYTSWGINRDPEAALVVAFGRPVQIDEAVVYLRADFPHDAWWQQASLTFSDGETVTLPLAKTGAGQSFALAPREVEWVRLHSLVKADDPSPFPALTQIELWGRDVATAG